MTIDDLQTCRLCGGTFTIRALIEASSKHWGALNVTVSQSPCCQSREELCILTNKVERGYVYAAGAPHFCPRFRYNRACFLFPFPPRLSTHFPNKPHRFLLRLSRFLRAG